MDPSRVIANASLAGLIVPNLSNDANFADIVVKSGLIYMMRHIAVDLGPKYITFNSICLGFSPTNMTAGSIERMGGAEVLAKTAPNRKGGTVEDIMGVIVFIAIKTRSHLNGVAIPINGGMMLRKADV
jgi:NAD(P)-dependent dehydrogenase (short-subunit alcohol dehydrogenase family)